MAAANIGSVALSPQRARVAASLSRPVAAAQLHEWQRQGLEIAELRLDRMAAVSADAARDLIAATRALPVLLTLRAASEGGDYRGSEEARCALLCDLAASGDALDIELAAAGRPAVAAAAKAQGKTLILSRHDFDRTASGDELDDTAAAAQAAGGDIVKYAGWCGDDTALQTLIDFAQRCAAAGQPCIAIGMGDNEHARDARLLLPRAGSCLAFAAVDGASAPGQLGLAETVAACRAGAAREI